MSCFPISKAFVLARITDDYHYDKKDPKMLWHSRSIRIVLDGIPFDLFNQQMKYTLRAYRTVFRIKDEKEFFETIRSYAKEVEFDGFR